LSDLLARKSDRINHLQVGFHACYSSWAVSCLLVCLAPTRGLKT
jgi:hypothetical protein